MKKYFKFLYNRFLVEGFIFVNQIAQPIPLLEPDYKIFRIVWEINKELSWMIMLLSNKRFQTGIISISYETKLRNLYFF